MSESKSRKDLGIFFIVLMVILLLVVGWYFLALNFGLGFALLGVWSTIVVTVALFCIAIVLFFLFSGIAAFILAIMVSLWAIIAITLSPILFPIFVPLMIVLLVISLMARRRK